MLTLFSSNLMFLGVGKSNPQHTKFEPCYTKKYSPALCIMLFLEYAQLCSVLSYSSGELFFFFFGWLYELREAISYYIGDLYIMVEFLY